MCVAAAAFQKCRKTIAAHGKKERAWDVCVLSSKPRDEWEKESAIPPLRSCLAVVARECRGVRLSVCE